MRSEDIAFLFVGAVVVVVVGQLLTYTGRRYVSRNDSSGRGLVAVLASVVFHLVTFGLLALVSVLPVGSTPMQSFMIRLGILLLVLGVVYAVTLAVLSRHRVEATTIGYRQEQRRPIRSSPQDTSAPPTPMPYAYDANEEPEPTTIELEQDERQRRQWS